MTEYSSAEQLAAQGLKILPSDHKIRNKPVKPNRERQPGAKVFTKSPLARLTKYANKERKTEQMLDLIMWRMRQACLPITANQKLQQLIARVFGDD